MFVTARHEQAIRQSHTLAAMIGAAQCGKLGPVDDFLNHLNR